MTMTWRLAADPDRMITRSGWDSHRHLLAVGGRGSIEQA